MLLSSGDLCLLDTFEGRHFKSFSFCGSLSGLKLVWIDLIPNTKDRGIDLYKDNPVGIVGSRVELLIGQRLDIWEIGVHLE